MMSDSLAAINVDQLSNAVNAVVNGSRGGQSHHTASSVSQNTMGLQMPPTIPVSIPSTVMIQVDRQLLNQLALHPSVSTNEVQGIDSALLQNSASLSSSFQAVPTQHQNRFIQSNLGTVIGTPTTPQNTLLNTQMMTAPTVTSRQPSVTQNVSLNTLLGSQMLSAPSSNGSPAVPFNAPMNTSLNTMLGTQMMVPSIITSMVPATTTQSAPLSTFLGSPLVLARDGSLTAGITNAFMTKPGGEQMIFNIQPEVSRGSNSSNSNNNVLQLVPISNSGLTNNQQAGQNPMINMSIAIHLPTHNNQSKDPNAIQKQSRTIPLSQLMTGQPIPVSQIAGPLLEASQERGSLPSSTLSVAQLSNTQGVSLSRLATHLAPDQGQSTGTIQPQMSIPLSQLGMAQAIPVSQVTSQIPDSLTQQVVSCQQSLAPHSIQIPQSVLQSFQAHSVTTPSNVYVTSTSTPCITTTMQATTSVSTNHAPVITVNEMQGKPYWNIHSLDQASQLTSQLAPSLTSSLTSQTLDVSSVPSITNVAKSQRQGGVDLGMVSISPDGLVTSMSAEEMTALDLGASESIENLTMPFEVESSTIWCVDCNHYNPTTCTTHGPPTIIRDGEIPCKAKLTLPTMLKLSDTLVGGHGNRYGVIAVERVEARCQFGPLIGKIISKDESILETHSTRLWKIYRNGVVGHCIDISDENQCNWMTYVKLANRTHEQNLVAHQSGGNIYFTTNKLIMEGEELRLWYSKDYAQWQGVPDTPESSFHCTQCPMHFFQRKQLIHHLGYKHPDMTARRYKCTLCPRAFISNTKLQLHMLTHMGLKPYKCEHCGKPFSDPSNLRIHTKIHTEERRFICDICHKAFRQKIHLIAHMTTHTGEKLLKCPFCDLTFATHSTLRQHKYSHETSEQEFECEKCERKFKNQRMLQKHAKTHTWKRDFQCMSCNKGFYTRYHAKRHYQSCKGPREEKDKNQDKTRVNGEDKMRRPRTRRGRPGRHQRKTFGGTVVDTDEGTTCGTSTCTESHIHGEDTADNLEEVALSRRESRGETSREGKWLPLGKNEGPTGEILSDSYRGDSDPAEIHAGGLSAGGERSSEDKRQRQSSKRGTATETVCSSQSERHDGRPVRVRKAPKRYAQDDDPSSDKKTEQLKDNVQNRRSSGIYTVNIADTRISVPVSSGHGGSIAYGAPSTSDDYRATHLNITHTLGSNILEDNPDTRGSHSNSLSPLMGNDNGQNTNWHSTLRVNPLENPLTMEQGSEAIGSLPMETSTLPLAVTSQSTDAASPLETPGSLFAARSSSMATRSMSMQMRREPTSDMEANEQCDDEERAGTVNENVEE